jgi:lipopolysaccharide biosynthesis glycosyltransferase
VQHHMVYQEIQVEVFVQLAHKNNPYRLMQLLVDRHSFFVYLKSKHNEIKQILFSKIIIMIVVVKYISIDLIQFDQYIKSIYFDDFVWIN